jgi:organic radical activating enzyme
MMRVEEIKSGLGIKPLKYSIQETPHSTIETNMTCNMKCRCCYNLDRDIVKSLAEVKAEIDLIVQKRKLQVITLLGGEPTLHPHLGDIISYIKSKKLICQVLTNGVVFLDDKAGRCLDSILGSGVDRIIFHIDIGQSHIHRDIDEARETLFSRLEEKNIHFGLSITIYNEYQEMIPRLIQKCSKYRFFGGILAVLARNPFPPKIQNAQLYLEYKSLHGELDLEPTAYIPSNLDDRDISWLIYLYFINSKTGRTLSISPGLDRLLRRTYRLVRGHHAFVILVNPRFAAIAAFFTCLGEIFSNPRKISAIRKFIGDVSLLGGLRFHCIAIQTPPEYDEEKNELRLCYHCPDATIRNGLLTPVCLADKINPLDNKREADRNWSQIVYSHLEELSGITAQAKNQSKPSSTIAK